MDGHAEAAEAHLEWEAARNRAAMETARARADAAEHRAAEQEAQRKAEERPRQDPDVTAFVARMTGQPGPLTLQETLLKHQMTAPPEDSAARDLGAEYGSAQNPARWLGESFREIPAEPVRRSASWEWELDRTLARAREQDLWFTGYLVRHNYPAALARARAKQQAVARSAGTGWPEDREITRVSDSGGSVSWEQAHW